MRFSIVQCQFIVKLFPTFANYPEANKISIYDLSISHRQFELHKGLVAASIVGVFLVAFLIWSENQKRNSVFFGYE